MPPKSVTSSSTHHVVDGSVSLSIVIGDAQIGSSVVRRQNEKGDVLGLGEINGLSLGSGAELRGTAVYVKSIVTDINDASNFTSISYVLEDGDQTTPLDLSATVDTEGDSVVYRMTINFE